MKKTEILVGILIAIFALKTALANCPTGMALAPLFVRVAPGQPCPPNYVPTDKVAVPNDDGTCPPNYMATDRAISVEPCDSARGVCDDNIFVCIVH